MPSFTSVFTTKQRTTYSTGWSTCHDIIYSHSVDPYRFKKIYKDVKTANTVHISNKSISLKGQEVKSV